MNISKPNSSYLHWFIVSIFFFYQYILRILPSIIYEELKKQFNIDAAIFGQLAGAFYIGYGLALIPIGIFMDRYGPKRVVSLCIFFHVIGQLPFIFCKQWGYALMGRCIVGASASGGILGVFKVIRIHFKDQHFTRMLSFSLAIGLLGAIYGGGPMGYFCAKYDYTHLLKAIACAGVGLLVLVAVLLPDSSSLQTQHTLTHLKKVLANPAILLGGLCTGLLVGASESFATTWAPIFLQKVYGYTALQANSFPTCLFLGLCAGGPCLSYIAQKWRSYFGTMASAGLIIAILFVGMLLGLYSERMMGIAFFILGVCSTYQVLAVYAVSKYAPQEMSSVAAATINSINMSMGYFFNAIIGGVVCYTDANNEAVALQYGIAVLPLFACLGSLGFLFLRYMYPYQAK